MKLLTMISSSPVHYREFQYVYAEGIGQMSLISKFGMDRGYNHDYIWIDFHHDGQLHGEGIHIINDRTEYQMSLYGIQIKHRFMTDAEKMMFMIEHPHFQFLPPNYMEIVEELRRRRQHEK